MYPLRILTPCDEDLAKASLAIWKAAPLLKTSLTEPAEMLASKDMLVVEDVGEDALPTSTTAAQNQSPTERFSQIGVDAATKILVSLLSADSMEANVAALAVVDLSPRTGDFGVAALNLMQGTSIPLHYIACTEDDSHSEWLTWWLKHKTSEALLSGALKPPGFQLPPEEPLPEELVGLPPKPTLSALVWADRQGESATARLPEDVSAKWSASEFADSMKKLEDQISALVADPVVAPPSSQRPRTDNPPTGSGAAPPPPAQTTTIRVAEVPRSRMTSSSFPPA